MLKMQSQSQSKAQPEASRTRAQTGLLQRKCDCANHTIAGGECSSCSNEREGTLQRSAISRHLGKGQNNAVPPIVHEVLKLPGQPLDAQSRAFMAPRFGHDFSQVRIHTDARAGASAHSVGAHAYTVGSHVVFAPQEFKPETESGRRRIAHELAHVVQQRGGAAEAAVYRISQPDERAEIEADTVALSVMRDAAPARSALSVSGVLQRAPTPPTPGATTPFYQEALDALAQERKQIITIVQSQMIPDSVPVLEALVALCEAIDRGAAADISKALTDFLASKTEHLPLSTPSNELVAEMVTRMLALGLDAEAQKFRRWGVARDKEISPGFHGGFSGEIFMWERIEERLLAQIPEMGGAVLTSIDALLLLFKQLLDERFSLSADEITKDQKRRAEQFDNYFVQRDRTISVYAAELVRLIRETFIGIQTAFQVLLDQAADDLAQGRGGAMLQNAKDRLENNLLGLIEPADKTRRVTGVPVETTRSEFKTGGGVHFDYFARDEAAKKKRSVKFHFYDREQLPSLASEMQSDFSGVFLARRRQIELLEKIYGLQKDDQGNLTAETKENAAAIKKLGAGGMQLHSDDDWRKFVKEKFDLREATDGPEKALVAVITLLEEYMRVFTTHTPYDIDDFGDNLLTKTFPRDLAGRLIHDCGVYALRVAYILSLLRDHPKLHLRFRYLVMPLHVGLIITGDSLPLFLVNNDTITRYAPADVAALRAEWNKLDEKGAEATPKKPATEARFVGEVMAHSFISDVDLPDKSIDVTRAAGSPATIKAQLWQQYTRDVAPSAGKLFGPSVGDPNSPNYQFDLRYLKLLGLLKDHYNNSIVPFWNVAAWGLWDQHKSEITQAFTALQQAATDKKVTAQKTYDDAVKKYADNLTAAYTPVQTATKPITDEQNAIQAHVAAHPDVFARGVEVKSAERVRMMFYLGFGITGTDLDMAIYRHLDELRNGTNVDAPFAKPENRLLPIN